MSVEAPVRVEHLETKKEESPTAPEANIFISTSQLLGYRGSEKIWATYVPNLPKTFDGRPIPKYIPQVDVRDPRRLRAGLRMRPFT